MAEGASPLERLCATTHGAAVAELRRAFRAAGLDTPALDARRLVEWVLGVDGASLLRDPDRPLSQPDSRRIADACRRRLAREPVSRIIGMRGFHGLDFEIGPASLDPRPETETLVDGVLGLIANGLVPGGNTPQILDLGTGSGAILVALLTRLPESTGVGVDISLEALAIARRNVDRHGLAGRAMLQASSWFEAVTGTFDLIVANPPYIPTSEIEALDPEVHRYDPHAALDGGPDGLEPYRRIAAGAAQTLRPGGWLVTEIGMGQSDSISAILAPLASPTAGDGAIVWHDLSGTARCVAVRART